MHTHTHTITRPCLPGTHTQCHPRGPAVPATNTFHEMDSSSSGAGHTGPFHSCPVYLLVKSSFTADSGRYQSTSGCPSMPARAASGPSSAVPRAAAPVGRRAREAARARARAGGHRHAYWPARAGRRRALTRQAQESAAVRTVLGPRLGVHRERRMRARTRARHADRRTETCHLLQRLQIPSPRPRSASVPAARTPAPRAHARIRAARGRAPGTDAQHSVRSAVPRQHCVRTRGKTPRHPPAPRQRRAPPRVPPWRRVESAEF